MSLVPHPVSGPFRKGGWWVCRDRAGAGDRKLPLILEQASGRPRQSVHLVGRPGPCSLGRGKAWLRGRVTGINR